MPGNEPTSEQLHTVVYLIAGMGDSEPVSNEPDKPTPTDKLKEALSSKEAFKKQYLYHAELGEQFSFFFLHTRHEDCLLGFEW